MPRAMRLMLALSLSACTAGPAGLGLTGLGGRVFDAEARRTLRAGVILHAEAGAPCTLSLQFDDGAERFDLALDRLLYVRGDGREISLGGGMYGRVVLQIRPHAGAYDSTLTRLTSAARGCGARLRD